jgi:crossover junction endodeoxyribonuclease RuvC
MTILGIDPGTRRIGYGIISKDKNGIKFLSAGVLKIKNRGGFESLKEISLQIRSLIKKWRPNFLAIEKLYFVKNVTTGLPVAEARGVIILTSLEAGVKVKEFSPNEIKAGLTGYGHADKKAVLKMVRLTLGRQELKLIDDASDALAVAIFAGQASRPGS